MSPVLTPDTPLAVYLEQTQQLIGKATRYDLGVLDAVTIGRYAMTIGSSDPIHFDRDTAIAAGYADVVAPINMLASIFEWGVGVSEDLSNIDGTPLDSDYLVGSSELELRAMGAGEVMELVAPAVAGMHLLLDTTIESAVGKSTRSGPCVFVTTTNVFHTTDGTIVNRNSRTIVLRNPHEES